MDVHARSVVACAIEERSGEVTHRRFGGDPPAVVQWLSSLPGPVQSTYEAGPTGFGRRGNWTRRGSCVWWRRRRSCSGQLETR